MNVLARLWDALRHTGPIKSNYRVIYSHGPTVDSVERGRTTRWYIDGVRVPEEAARVRMQVEEAARRTRHP